METSELRPYQEECLAAIEADYLAGLHQLLVVMATGTGKTVVFAKLIARMRKYLPGKVLVFAHREELVDQAIATIRQFNPNLKVGKEMANDRAEMDCDGVVSCVASIGRTGATRLERFGGFSLVICDEAHHSIAETYLNVFSTTGVLLEGTNKLLVGFTATPKRKNLTRKEKKDLTLLDDEQLVSLKSVYKKISYTYPIRKAIKEGRLSPLKGFRLKTDIDLTDVKQTAGDYQEGDLGRTVNTPARNRQIVKMWLEHMENRPTVGFCAGIQHAKDLAKEFIDAGIKAEAIWGEDSGRARKLQNHKAGEIVVLCNAQLLTEGYDDWRVSCIILAAPTRNSSRFTQEVGRGTRLQAGIGNLLKATIGGCALTKKDCYILDVVDNSKRCSLVTLPSLLGLNPDMDLGGRDVVDATEQMEALQEQYPGVNLSGLVDLSKVQAYIESIDIFAAPFTEEVQEFSTLSWIATSDGEYVLPIPEKKDLADAAKKNGKVFARYLHEKLHIRQNELDEWELSLTSTTVGERKLGTFNDLKEAFEIADDVIQRNRYDRVKLMLRDSPLDKFPASGAQKKYLRKLSKSRPLFWCLCEASPMYSPTDACPVCKKKMGITSGMASLAINKLQHAR
jgi:superfamily II DNA or RNA helicase